MTALSFAKILFLSATDGGRRSGGARTDESSNSPPLRPAPLFPLPSRKESHFSSRTDCCYLSITMEKEREREAEDEVLPLFPQATTGGVIKDRMKEMSPEPSPPPDYRNVLRSLSKFARRRYVILT